MFTACAITGSDGVLAAPFGYGLLQSGCGKYLNANHLHSDPFLA